MIRKSVADLDPLQLCGSESSILADPNTDDIDDVENLLGNFYFIDENSSTNLLLGTGCTILPFAGSGSS